MIQKYVPAFVLAFFLFACIPVYGEEVSGVDLVVSKSATVKPTLGVERGETVEYTVSYQNIGSESAKVVIIEDQYGLNGIQTLVAVPEGCEDRQGKLICFIGDMAPNQKESFSYSTVISDESPDFSALLVRITSAQEDRNTSNNSALFPLRIISSGSQASGEEEEKVTTTDETSITTTEAVVEEEGASNKSTLPKDAPVLVSEVTTQEKSAEPLSLSFTPGKSSVKEGDTIVFTATITNNTDKKTEGLLAEYSFPGEYLSLVSTGDANPVIKGDVMTFSKKSLLPGEEWSFSVTARAKSDVTQAKKFVTSLSVSSQNEDITAKTVSKKTLFLPHVVKKKDVTPPPVSPPVTQVPKTVTTPTPLTLIGSGPELYILLIVSLLGSLGILFLRRRKI